jgi:uncharacterized protein YecE (DUF72 family)
MQRQLRIGCAGWAIPKRHSSSFPKPGINLERYAQRFNAIEINSSFYRPHLRTTYERWAAAVPSDFAFAVKVPKEITHGLHLANAAAALDAFLAQVAGLGGKLGPLLFQLPPSLAFDAEIARSFFAALRLRFDGNVVCEPRNPDWFTAPASDLMTEFGISRAAIDPLVAATAAIPGGSNNLIYFRLHGSPRIYFSEYNSEELNRFAHQLAREISVCHTAWCIFDNTAAGAATANALALQKRLRELREI